MSAADYLKKAVRELSPFLWLDVSEESASSAVSVVYDLRTAIAKISQTTGSKQPSIIENHTNGLSVLSFDGVSEICSMTGHTVADFTFIILGTPSGSVVRPQIGKTDTPINSISFGSDRLEYRDSNTSTEYIIYYGETFSTTDCVIGMIARGSSTLYGSINGKSYTPISCSTTNHAYNVFGGRVEGGWVNYFNGEIGEVLLFDNKLSDANIQLIDGYLAFKWGITLDTGHPYTPITISGTALKGSGGGVDVVNIYTDSGFLIATATPNVTTGDWSVNIPAGNYYVTYLSSGCKPVTHGPYTVS